MPSPKRNLVDCVWVGNPPRKLLSAQTVRFVIHDFKNHHATKRGELILSPILRAHGCLWTIKLYPRGCVDSSPDTEYVSCFLKYAEKTLHKPAAIIDMRCKQHELKGSHLRVFGDCWGYKHFLERDDILENYLEEDGSLVIEVDIQLAVEEKLVWYPEELKREDTLVKLYQNATSESADVVFDVGGKEYRVHKNILRLRAKTLFELSMEQEGYTPVPIINTRPETFKVVLDFVYTVKVPEVKNEDTATEMLVAADRFDCADLKLYIESVIVDKFLAPINAATLVILADSHSCALLKEAAMDCFVFDSETVMKSEGWSKIEESKRLLREVLNHVSLRYLPSGKTDSGYSEKDVDRLDVTSIREQLQTANTALDGSREILVKRLRRYHESLLE
eukprot:jgi/Psemu1/295646/fgenesh1_pm.79_\